MATNSTPDTATLIANTIANNKANPLYGNQALTPQQLQPVSPIRTVPVGDTTSGLAGITASVGDQIAGDLGNIQNQIAQQEKLNAQGGNDLTKLIQGLGNQPADLVAENARQGVNEETANFNKLQEQLLGLNAQASGLNREAQAIPLLTQQNLTAQGRIASEGGIAPENSAALRNNAIKALSIAAQSDIALAAAQGSEIRLNAAKDKAKQIVDIKYAQIEAELKAKQLQYDLNKDVLTRLDAKRTEALGVALKKEERELLAEKELATYKAEATTTALAAGAPKSVIDAAGNAKTSLEVAQILGKYSPETLKYELLKEQIKTEKAQRANIYNTIKARNADTARQDAESSGSGGVKLTADEKKANTASVALVGLLDEYRKEIEGISFLQANSAAKRTAINSLKGRITAEYKQAKQLGTLDAGVQKLIDSIIPNPGSLSISSLNNTAQVKAINDFKASFLPATPEGQYVEKMIPMIQKSNSGNITSDSYANSL